MSSFLPISMRHAIREQNRKVQHSSRQGEGFLDHASNLMKDETQTRAEQERRKEVNQSRRSTSSNVQISSQARKHQQDAIQTKSSVQQSDQKSSIEELEFPPGSVYDEEGKINPPQTPDERSSFNRNI